MKRNLLRYLGVAIISISIFMILGQAESLKNKVFASTISYTESISQDNLMYNFKIITGEKLVKVEEEHNVYKADISNNMNKIEMQFTSMPGVNSDDFIVTGSDNTISGVISKQEPILIVDNLKEGINIIRIRKKIDNKELYKFYINYKNVEISGIEPLVNSGDKFNLYGSIDNKVCNNVKWTSVGINSVMIGETGQVTAVNRGIASIIATIYDDKDENIIGSISLQFNVCGQEKLGWINNSGKWYYIDENTKSFKIGWLNNHGSWYYLNSDGSMETKTKEIDGKVYSFNKVGELQ